MPVFILTPLSPCRDLDLSIDLELQSQELTFGVNLKKQKFMFNLNGSEKRNHYIYIIFFLAEFMLKLCFKIIKLGFKWMKILG